MAALDFDAIVAGAGAGGAAAACCLTGAGLRVLVVDRARLPRHKPCGGAIPRAALTRFPFGCAPVVRAEPALARFTFPGLPPAETALPGQPVVMVMRSEFDAWLLSQSGAEVEAGRAVTGVVETAGAVRVEAGDRVYSARYLVGADGPASVVARSAGLRARRQFGSALEAEVPLDGGGPRREWHASRAVFSLGAVPWGYGWVFPKGDCLSVGVARLRPGRVDLRRALHRHAAGLGIGLDGVPVHGHPIPFYRSPPWPFWHDRPQEPLATRRVVLVGDAAGLVDPFHGEGIRYALGSARLAAEAIARDDLAGYEAAIWREMGHSLATAGLVAQLYYRLPWLSYQLGTRNPATLRHLVDLQAGRLSYEGVGRRILALTLLWLIGRSGRGCPTAMENKRRKNDDPRS